MWIVEGDTCDLDSLLKAFEGINVVYHLAGYISLRLGLASRNMVDRLRPVPSQVKDRQACRPINQSLYPQISFCLELRPWDLGPLPILESL